jgi:hypothetical protein
MTIFDPAADAASHDARKGITTPGLTAVESLVYELCKTHAQIDPAYFDAFRDSASEAERCAEMLGFELDTLLDEAFLLGHTTKARLAGSRLRTRLFEKHVARGAFTGLTVDAVARSRDLIRQLLQVLLDYHEKGDPVDECPWCGVTRDASQWASLPFPLDFNGDALPAGYDHSDEDALVH